MSLLIINFNEINLLVKSALHFFYELQILKSRDQDTEYNFIMKKRCG